MVRQLLANGWNAEDLALGVSPDEGEPLDIILPPALTGAELAVRAKASEAAQPSSSG